MAKKKVTKEVTAEEILEQYQDVNNEVQDDEYVKEGEDDNV